MGGKGGWHWDVGGSARDVRWESYTSKAKRGTSERGTVCTVRVARGEKQGNATRCTDRR